MTEKTEALRLAAELTRYLGCGGTASQAAAELRRLAKVEDEWAALSQDQGKLESQIDRLVAQRDALLEALKIMRDKYGEYACRACDRADAAIAKAEEA